MCVFYFVFVLRGRGGGACWNLSKASTGVVFRASRCVRLTRRTAEMLGHQWDGLFEVERTSESKGRMSSIKDRDVEEGEKNFLSGFFPNSVFRILSVSCVDESVPESQ